MNPKDTYESYKSAGICTQCRKRPALPSRCFCEECTERNRVFGQLQKARRYAKRLELIERRRKAGII